MNIATSALICASLALAANIAPAQDAPAKTTTMPKEGMMKKNMGMQDCRERMVMNKRDGMKSDDASQKQDKACADMMKADEPVKKDTPPAPMKK